MLPTPLLNELHRPKEPKWQWVKRLSKNVLYPFLMVVATAFVVYHTLVGNYNFFTVKRLEADLETAKTRLGTLQTRYDDLKRKSESLGGERPLDMDLLTEEVRKLGFSQENELVLRLKPEGQDK